MDLRLMFDGTRHASKLSGLVSSHKFTEVSIEQLRRVQQMFAEDRDWQQFHTPRNLLLALVGEVSNRITMLLASVPCCLQHHK